MHFYASKFQKFSLILFIKITFQVALITGSKRKAGELCKENVNANNVESQKFQNDPILTSQPCCHPLHRKILRVILTVTLNMLNLYNYISYFLMTLNIYF